MTKEIVKKQISPDVDIIIANIREEGMQLERHRSGAIDTDYDEDGIGKDMPFLKYFRYGINRNTRFLVCDVLDAKTFQIVEVDVKPDERYKTSAKFLKLANGEENLLSDPQYQSTTKYLKTIKLKAIPVEYVLQIFRYTDKKVDGIHEAREIYNNFSSKIYAANENCYPKQLILKDDTVKYVPQSRYNWIRRKKNNGIEEVWDFEAMVEKGSYGVIEKADSIQVARIDQKLIDIENGKCRNKICSTMIDDNGCSVKFW